MHILTAKLLIFLILTWPATAWAAGNESASTQPVTPGGAPTASFLSDLRNILGGTVAAGGSAVSGCQGEDACRFAEQFPGGMVFSGGTHATAGSCTSTAFATTAYTPAGNRVRNAPAAIDYSTVGCNCADPGSDTAWVIASALSADASGNFQRVSGTDYFVDCVSTDQPTLPSDSTWLMQVSLVNGAINAVTDLRVLYPSSQSGDNTHRLSGGLEAEQRAWFADGFAPYIVSGCAPVVPVAGLTFAAFACTGYTEESGVTYYSSQAAAAVTVPNSATVWLALHRERGGTPSGCGGGNWTRVTGTHYLTCANATYPTHPVGGQIFTRVTVSGGNITAVGNFAYRSPIDAHRGIHSVSSFGAIPDDGISDSAAIQNAIDAACALPTGGARVELGNGTWNIGALLVLGCNSLVFEGISPEATHLRTNGNNLLDVTGGGGATGLSQRIVLRNFSATEGVGGNTTSVGVNFTTYCTQQCRIENLRLYGFGGDELRINGGSHMVIADNYISHNRAGSTGNGLHILRHTTQGSNTTTTSKGNYFASTVAGAGPMVLVENSVSFVSIRDIFELVPAGVVGFRGEANGGNNAQGYTFIQPHFESIAGTAWEMSDVADVVVVSSFGAAPAYSWSAVPVASRYSIELGPNGNSGVVRNLANLLVGLTGFADFDTSAGVQVGPLKGATSPRIALTTETDTIGRNGAVAIWARTTGQTYVQIGQMFVEQGASNATAPDGIYTVQTTTAGSATLTTRLEASVNGLRPMTSTFAALPAAPNGFIIFCSDCTVANPCAGAGTGAIAKRLNSAWVCN